ncbi:MAG: hypothetical protein F6K60_32315 [Okeania sp. SIO1F9]|nr:hypothetical protein [Okeania sp. SIO1F9]
MTVKLLKVASKDLVNGVIRKGKIKEMPSIQTGWQFNFNKHIKLPNSQTYVLVTEENPDIIEGCLVFQMQDKVVPYLAYVEVAPHNKTKSKRHSLVAGCLIAYACKLSFEQGKNFHQGYLTFDVMEENEEDQNKLMKLYRTKYNAIRVAETTMLIVPKEGKTLIELYLE